MLLARGGRRAYFKYKEAARQLVHARIAYFNHHYRCEIKRISIRDQRSRWGSCSRKGNLNFNYKIVFLPPALADYIVVHELCHLRAFSHSRAFWHLVGATLPQHRELRRLLRRYRLR